MKVKDFIVELQNNCQEDLDINIECPNGLLVKPQIKVDHEVRCNPFSPKVGYVISWRN